MRSQHWINVAAFIGCIAGGFWIGRGIDSSPSTTVGAPSMAVASVETMPQGKGDALRGEKSEAAGNHTKSNGPLAEEIQWRERLEALPLSQFPSLFEEELKRSAEAGSVSLLLQVWRELDLENYILWMKTQPDFRLLGQATNFGVGSFRDAALAKLAETDPERAWKLANQCLTPGSRERWSVLRTLISKDGNTALEFFGKHKDVFLCSDGASDGFFGFEPTKAMPILTEFPVGRERTQIVGTMARYYEDYSKDPKAGGAWFDSLSQEDKKNWSEAAIKGYPPIPKVFDAKMEEFRKTVGGGGTP